MKVCPYCGAENADSSEFCSLCLAGLALRNTPSVSDTHGGDPQAQPAQPYVSPGDYHALAREMAQQPPVPSGQGPGYYGTAAQQTTGLTRVSTPALGASMSKTDIAILLLSYSFVTYLILFFIRFLLSMFLLGAAFGGSEAGFSIGIAMLFIADALVLAAGGYMISARAMQNGRGWMFGAGCAACVVLLWQPLVSLILVLLITGEVYVPIFTLTGILFTLFLELPMGALGGWFAEKRLMG